MCNGVKRMLECTRNLSVVRENERRPLHFEDYGVLPIKNQTAPRGNRQESIYDTTKRNYFVIKSNLHCSEHP